MEKIYIRGVEYSLNESHVRFTEEELLAVTKATIGGNEFNASVEKTGEDTYSISLSGETTK